MDQGLRTLQEKRIIGKKAGKQLDGAFTDQHRLSARRPTAKATTAWARQGQQSLSGAGGEDQLPAHTGHKRQDDGEVHSACASHSSEETFWDVNSSGILY